MAQARRRASTVKKAEASVGLLCSVSFCPICMAVTTASEVRPEFVDHLMVAGREFLLALRAVIDARLEGVQPHGKLERLTIE